MKKKTVGRQYYERQEKQKETYETREISQPMIDDIWNDNVFQAIGRFKKTAVSDFYITVLLKKERLMPNGARMYFVPRYSCPTPTPDQTVYKYYLKEERLEYLWTVPDIQTCHQFYNYPFLAADNEKELRDYAIDFITGDLLLRAKKENNEARCSNVIENNM